jgi:hypothetical protein
MTDVVAVFPSTSKRRIFEMLVNHRAHPMIIRWVDSWLTDESIERWIDGNPAGRSAVGCGVPRRSTCFLVLFLLTFAGVLRELMDGISYVDDCGSVISFTKQMDLHEEATALLQRVNDTLEERVLQLDESKM